MSISEYFDSIKSDLVHLRQQYDPLIIIPDLAITECRNPFHVILYKIFENNTDFRILTPKEIGVDFILPFSVFGKEIFTFIINDKLIWIDFNDKGSLKFSNSGIWDMHFRADQLGGIIKLQHFGAAYIECPILLYPFFYPGFNDYRDFSDRNQTFRDRHPNVLSSPFVDINQYRTMFKNCYDTNKFQHSIFARWSRYPDRKTFARLSEQIPNSNVHTRIWPNYEYTLEDYITKMSTSRFAISVRGGGKFSHREMESAAIGVPLLYQACREPQQMLEPFLPNVHYIPVTPETFIDQCKYYLDHYDEALQIGQNARNYYDENLSQAGIQKGFKKIVDMMLRGERWIEGM